VSTSDSSASSRKLVSARGSPFSHTVQFYEDEPFLLEAVLRFLTAGLDSSEPAVVIATSAHRSEIAARLESRGVDVEAAIQDRRLMLLDARETLAQFMVAGLPDWIRFRSMMKEILSGILASGNSMKARAYGEMVDLLLREGNPHGALLLEEQWNELGSIYPFSLLCGYSMDGFSNESDAQVFHEVCGVHSHVVPTERYSQIESGEDRLREISVLQQRAKALENEIALRKQMEAQLLEALRARDDFLAVAGHELKTPLTALQLQIHSLTSLVKRVGVEEVAEKTERACRQVERLSSLTEELLDVSRLCAGRFELEVESCDLCALVSEIIHQSAEAAARVGCELSVKLSGPIEGLWDRLRVEQVVRNLLSNAFKYGPGKPVEVEVERAKDRARLVVRDGGIGVSPEDQARIFDRFERAVSASHYGGLGLGLWIARQVVEAHGGTIRIESELGFGSAFVVELPCAAQSPSV
jgi:signal transduction histidine kinase